MDSIEYVQTELILRDVIIAFEKLKRIDTFETRQELLTKIDNLTRRISDRRNIKKENNSSSQDVNYII
jgi:hypothetical protein